MTPGFFADAKKSGPGAIPVQHVQHLRGDDGIGAIINGQGDFISGRGAVRQPCPVRAQPVAARPQADERNEQVIDDHRAQRPAPLSGRQDDGGQGQQMQGARGTQQKPRLPA